MTDEELLQKFGKIVDKQIGARLEPLNRRFNRLDDRLGGVEKRLDNVDDRLGGVENQLKTTNRTLKRVAKDVSYITKTFDEEIVSNRRRISKIENQLGSSLPQ